MNNLAKRMGDFERGVDSVGQLFPASISHSDRQDLDSAWESVAASFRQAGDSLRLAIKERSDAKREGKQTA